MNTPKISRFNRKRPELGPDVPTNEGSRSANLVGVVWAGRDKAGAETDVRRCSDALGPRKNLHRHAPHGRGHFIGMHPMSICPMGEYLMGVYLIDVHLMGICPMGAYLMGVHLMGVYLMGICPMGVYIMGMHLMGVYLMGVYLMGRAKPGVSTNEF